MNELRGRLLLGMVSLPHTRRAGRSRVPTTPPSLERSAERFLPARKTDEHCGYPPASRIRFVGTTRMLCLCAGRLRWMP